MADAKSPIDRIDAAIARIEAVTQRHADDIGSLTKRHAALRDHMAEAVAALDDLIMRGVSD